MRFDCATPIRAIVPRNPAWPCDNLSLGAVAAAVEASTKAAVQPAASAALLTSRGGGIRTRDLPLPKRVLYQAELHPVARPVERSHSMAVCTDQLATLDFLQNRLAAESRRTKLLTSRFFASPGQVIHCMAA